MPKHVFENSCPFSSIFIYIASITTLWNHLFLFEKCLQRCNAMITVLPQLWFYFTNIKLNLSIFFMEGAEQESLHQNIRVPGEVLTSNSRRGGRTKNCTICKKPRRGRDAAKDHEYMCLIGVPLCKISISWLTWSKIVYVLWGCYSNYD